MKTIKRTIGFALAITLFLVSFNEAKASVGRSAARNFINKTSYIISEAYEIVSYYNYYSTGYLAKSINHQQYAKYLYDRGFYSYAVYHSNLARKYSLQIIYSCNDYWNNYYNYYRYGFDYRKYHFAGRPIPPRPSSNSGYNPHPYNYHGNGHGNYHGQPSGKPAGGDRGNSGNYGTRQSNSGINANNKYSNSKYYSTANGVETKDFDTWNDSYYTADEKMLIVDMPAENKLTAELSKNASVSMKLSSDKDAVNRGIKTFSEDVTSYKNEKANEAETIAITSPKELSTAANRSSVRNANSSTVNSEPKAASTSTVTRPTTTTTTTSSSSVNRSVNTNAGSRVTTSSASTRTTAPASSSTTSKSMSTSTSTTTRSTTTSSSSAVRTAPASSSTTSKSTPSSSSSSSSTNRSTARH